MYANRERKQGEENPRRRDEENLPYACRVSKTPAACSKNRKTRRKRRKKKKAAYRGGDKSHRRQRRHHHYVKKCLRFILWLERQWKRTHDMGRSCWPQEIEANIGLGGGEEGRNEERQRTRRKGRGQMWGKRRATPGPVFSLEGVDGWVKDKEAKHPPPAVRHEASMYAYVSPVRRVVTVRSVWSPYLELTSFFFLISPHFSILYSRRLGVSCCLAWLLKSSAGKGMLLRRSFVFPRIRIPSENNYTNLLRL